MSTWRLSPEWQPDQAHLDLAAKCATAFGFSLEDLQSPSRKPDVVRARFAAMAVLRACFPGLTLCKLGRVFRRQDHTSVRYALLRAEALRASDTEFREITAALVAGYEPPESAKVTEDREFAQTVAAQRRRLTSEEMRHLALRFAIEELDAPPRRAPRAPRPYREEIEKVRLQPHEIAARRAAREAEVRARQLALLEAERIRYNLPRRGRALFEMPA